MICNAILTNRYIGDDDFFILGGTLTSPFVFILDDIIAEIYGYKVTRLVIITGFLMQLLLTIICFFVIISPSPSFFQNGHMYDNILGSSLFRITISGFFAYIIANLLNTYLITRWKIILKGKKFWLRMLCSSTFSEAIYSFLAILMMQINSIPLSDILKVALASYLIKASYSVIFAAPANILVNRVKKVTGIDVYDFPSNFTPFKFKREVSSS
jgi:uncharacterized integral membrane protein (TIGR00697 family)